MRLVLPHFLTGAAPPAISKVLTHVKRLDSLYGRFILPVLGWLVVAVAPLVSFDAGGGQTAIQIVRYVVFRGLDRDAWYAVSPLFMLSGALAASTILLGMTLHTVGSVFRDKTLAHYGCGTLLLSLLILVLATEPVATVSFFGIVVLPHVGWWLTLLYAAVALWSTSQWLFNPTVHLLNGDSTTEYGR